MSVIIGINYKIEQNYFKHLSQEIVRGSSRDVRLASARGRIKYKEIVVHVFVYLHDACLVGTAIAVVRCREYGNDVLIMTPVEAVHHELVRARYQFQVIDMVELL